ncbi:hypothetical protein ACUXJ9_000387 [Staphylococcus caledonicus]
MNKVSSLLDVSGMIVNIALILVLSVSILKYLKEDTEL